jgi:two-component system, cell cycle response regulator CpdR
VTVRLVDGRARRGSPLIPEKGTFAVDAGWKIRRFSIGFLGKNMSRVVLAVDDEPLMLDVTAEMLTDLGCEVVTASDAEEALEKLATNSRIEILVTDINMPGVNGCELAERAVRIYRGLKVIVVSGLQIDGCVGFPLLKKPFSQLDLKREMAHYTELC